jgi:DNA gyrase subunit A
VLDLKQLLQHFLDFRYETVRRRLEYQLAQLRKRIHILEGFAIVFDGLDRALKIIRASDGKKDAAKRLMAEFPLDEIQTDAILELQLYRISKLEINEIREELAAKKAEAARNRSDPEVESENVEADHNGTGADRCRFRRQSAE